MDIAGLIILCAMFFAFGVAAALSWERSRRRRYERRITASLLVVEHEQTLRARAEDRVRRAEQHLQTAVTNERRIIDEYTRSTSAREQTAA